MRALFVDDEVEFLELMHKRLTRRGMDVITAPDGQTALKLLDQAIQEGQTFEIVVMDVRMPGMDGLETLRHMKEKAPKIPVILLTGHACMGVAVQGLDQLRAAATAAEVAETSHLPDAARALRKAMIEASLVLAAEQNQEQAD